MLIILISLIVFSNQYLLFNEEFFIILAFFCLCYLVKTSLGSIVENELLERKNKVLNSYIDYLKKKSKHLSTTVKNIEQKIEYLYNYVIIQNEYFEKFAEMFHLLRDNAIIDLSKYIESGFIYYFAGLVSKKRKFL